MSSDGIDRSWLTERVREASAHPDNGSAEVDRLRELLERCADRFAERRQDVVSGTVTWPRRGLRTDEATSFLRAVDHDIAVVDEAGYVSMPTVRPKLPNGRYALLSKSGSGVSINLEYLIQVGATAELILDLDWPSDLIDFERGEFDALALDNDRVVLAMEAKARVNGPDSLERLVASWLTALENPELRPGATNSGRKLRELVRLSDRGPVLIWLVADGARWSLWAHQTTERSLTLTPVRSAHRSDVLGAPPEGQLMLETQPYDAALHRPGTAAHDGHCSWHGPVSCAQPPVISFQDRSGGWQSGCQRAVDELLARGDINKHRDDGTRE